MSGNGGKLLLLVGVITVAGGFLLFPIKTVLIGLCVVILSIYVLLFVTRDLSYLLILWFLVVPFFSASQHDVRTGMDLGAGNLTVDRLLFMFLIMLFLAELSLRRYRILSPSFVEVMNLVFCSVVFLSLETHGNLERTYIGVVVTRYLFPVLAYSLAKNLFTAEYQVRNFLWALNVLGIYIAVTAFFEFFQITSLVFPKYIIDENVGNHVGRARGPFLQAATNGTAMGMILLTSLYLYATAVSSSKRLFLLMITGMMLLGVLFSLTRGAWLGTAIGLLLLSIFQRDVRRVVIPAGVIAAVILPLIIIGTSQLEQMVGERAADSGTMDFRYNTWQAGLFMFLDYPIFGVGFRRYTDLHYLYQSDKGFVQTSLLVEEAQPAAHNTYIELGAELGLIGLIPYFTALLWLLTISIKLYRTSSPLSDSARSFIILLWGVASVYLISSFFYTQNSMFLTSLFLAFGGIIDRWSALLALAQHVRVQHVGSITPTATVNQLMVIQNHTGAGWQSSDIVADYEHRPEIPPNLWGRLHGRSNL